MKTRLGVVIALAASIAVGGCSASPTPSIDTEPPISREDAIAIVQARQSIAPGDEVLQAERGTFGELGSDYVPPGATPVALADQCVWRINMGHISGPQLGQGRVFILDCLSGALLQSYDWVT